MIPGDGLRELLAKWYECFCTYWSEKRYFRAILVIALPDTAAGLVLALLIKGILSAGNFLWQHAALFFFMFLGFCLFIAWLDKRKADRIKIEREEQEMRERRAYTAVGFTAGLLSTWFGTAQVGLLRYTQPW